MYDENFIDTTFDVRTDAGGKDPDATSETLKRYHMLLWSKKLPNGIDLNLNKKLRGTICEQEFKFSSDSIIHTYSKWESYKYIVEQIDATEMEKFRVLGYTIGGNIIFPSNRVEGKQTINAARGCMRKISDRFDLTLECIRLFYEGVESPLYDCFARYDNFFELFVDFRGYIDFFLLQDLVYDNYSKIKYFHSFENFNSNPLPATIGEYISYKSNVEEFVNLRNKRINEWQKCLKQEN